VKRALRIALILLGIGITIAEIYGIHTFPMREDHIEHTK